MMDRCFNFMLLERQKKEIRRRLYSHEYTVEEYYHLIHRRNFPSPSAWCDNCEGTHVMPYDGLPEPGKVAL